MNDEVFLNEDGIVETIYHGDQTAETVRRVLNEYHRLSGKVERSYLIDVADVGSTNVGARLEAVNGLRSLHFVKMASYGGNTYMKNLINFVIRAIGKQKQIKYFDTRAEATGWLKDMGD